MERKQTLDDIRALPIPRAFLGLRWGKRKAETIAYNLHRSAFRFTAQ